MTRPIRLSERDPLVQGFLEALGAPPNVISFELRAAVGEWVTVKLEYYPEDNGKVPAPALLREYDLV
jgi:hypothetical protein